MVFNTDFTLQVAREHQAELLATETRRPDSVRDHAARRRVGGWIVRLGQAVEGRAPVRPTHAWQP